jgi:hypothetical protein
MHLRRVRTGPHEGTLSVPLTCALKIADPHPQSGAPLDDSTRDASSRGAGSSWIKHPIRTAARPAMTSPKWICLKCNEHLEGWVPVSTVCNAM